MHPELRTQGGDDVPELRREAPIWGAGQPSNTEMSVGTEVVAEIGTRLSSTCLRGLETVYQQDLRQRDRRVGRDPRRGRLQREVGLWAGFCEAVYRAPVHTAGATGL